MRKQGADFVITDLKMEGVGGLEVTRAVKEIDPACPVLIVTAFGTVETAVEAIRLGAMDFLQKPFAPEVLRLKIERALELAGSSAGGPAPRPRPRRCAPTPPPPTPAATSSASPRPCGPCSPPSRRWRRPTSRC